jgi:hypothetical protein
MAMRIMRWTVPVLALLAVLTGTPARSAALAVDEDVPAPPGLKVETGPGGAIAVVRDHFPDADNASVDVLAVALRQAGFGVTFVSGAQAVDPRVLIPQRFFLVVLPDAAVYPAAGTGPLLAYLRNGGHLLALGGPAFSRPAWLQQGEWLDRGMIRDRRSRVATGRIVFDFEAGAAAWPRSSSDPEAKGGFEIVTGGADGSGHCARVWTDRLTGWSTHPSPESPGLFAPGHDLLGFWARGDAATPQMLTEVGEADGARWMAVVPLTTRWTYHVLGPDDFTFWPDAATRGRRGGTDDRLHPRDAVRLVLGLARSHTPALSSGPHAFWIDRIGTAADPFAGMRSRPGETFPPLETLYPSYKTYPLEHATTVVAAPDQAVVDSHFSAPAVPGLSAIARPAGRGFGNNRRWRWVPLLEARDASGQRRGTPAWLLLNQAEPFRTSIFAAFAVSDLKTLTTDPWRSALIETVRRIRQGVFLSEGGARRFAVRRGEKVELGATALNWGREPIKATLRLSVHVPGDLPVAFESKDDVTLHPGETRTVMHSAGVGGTMGEGRVVTELIVGGKVIDRIAHSQGSLDAGALKPGEFVTVKDSRFVVDGKPWYPVGINYWALYVAGLEPSTYGLGWLDPGAYDPEEVERDLQLMNALGINMVSITLGDMRSQPNLLDFLRRCRNHGVRVNGFLNGASPIGFNEAEVARFLEAGRLAHDPTIFAYDIIWEPGNWMFDAGGRTRWDDDWSAWIVERYGDLASAEADWGMPAPRRDGKVVSPSDHQLRDDGPWRVMVAAYRRFMDDLMSRKWNDAVTRLRALDPNHLISFRQGNTLPHDFALTAPTKHIDFICPEGYSIPPGEEGYNAAGFLTRYVAFTTRGKPVYWAEFGRSVWDESRARPDPGAFAGQAAYHELFYRVVLDAGASATAPWWWPGGYRVDEKSDFGIINPDGTPRPAASVVARYAARLAAPRAVPQPTTWFTFDRDAHAGGYWWTAFHEGAAAYAQARASGQVLGVRSPGTGTDSSTEPVVAVGNRPYNGHNPPKYLNAEFNRFQVLDRDGRWQDVRHGATVRVAAGAAVKARVRVGNTQEATWLAPTAGTTRGAVYLASGPGSDVALRLPIPRNTPYHADADLGEFVLAPKVDGQAHVVVRMSVDGRIGFGETRDVTLSSQ